MAFMNTTDLVQRCIVRLRQVSGVSTQTYSENVLAHLLEECYEQCRALRWWDHMTTWQTRTLDGTTGRVTVPFVGARERMRDVQTVYADTWNRELAFLTQHTNPGRLTGTNPRMVEALSVTDDPTGGYLFRVWPLTATGDVRVRLRADTVGVFTTATVIVPFDATALINGACMKYAVVDGTNPGSVMEFDRAYAERVRQLLQQHDSTPLEMDTRVGHQTDWIEDWR
jgi:hypothetical protein